MPREGSAFASQFLKKDTSTYLLLENSDTKSQQMPCKVRVHTYYVAPFTEGKKENFATLKGLSHEMDLAFDDMFGGAPMIL
jgi:hypothetical protein